MAEAIPSVLLYAQAVVLLKDLQDLYSTGDMHSIEDVAASLRDILTQFERTAGVPLLRYLPFAETEPPVASKMNETWKNMAYDVMILEQQLDILRAASVFAHNFVAMETIKSASENARVNNKLKTLQLYSDSVDSNIITFGDSFKSDQFIDPSALVGDYRANVGVGFLSLGQSGPLVDLAEAISEYDILEGSNGFAGNNQEIIDPTNATRDPVTNEPNYTFAAEVHDVSDIRAALDGNPDTWFEYEHCFVNESDRFTAGNYNFSYQTSADEEGGRIDWADGPDNGTLNLNLQFDLGEPKIVNFLSYTPYGLDNNKNYPVVVREIQTSSNGTDWTLVSPHNVWIGTDINLQTARSADQVVTGNAVWSFESRQVQFVRMALEQRQAVSAPIGHLYYINKDTGQRVEGPLPPVEDPIRFYDETQSVVGDMIREREYFLGKRWVIGIRDIALQQVRYAEESAIVTKPLRVGGVVDRVSLEADVFVPQGFPTSDLWVKFFISPDDGSNWYQISRIQDDYLGIPEIIAFNDPLPAEFREPGVQYQNTDNAVTGLRLKIVLSRPPDSSTSTPLVRSYRLKVRRR